MKILIVSGSRADLGLLHYPELRLREDGHDVKLVRGGGELGYGFAPMFTATAQRLEQDKPDMVLLLGDRWDILAAATAAHLKRIPIAHIAGGDISEGSYDDAMRDCISRMATIHFATSESSAARLKWRGYKNVHMVGNPAVDYLMHADWRRPRAIPEPYVLVAYYPETIDDTVDLEAVNAAINGRRAVWVGPNPDRGAERIPSTDSYSHDAFLNLMVNADEFIGNSSAMFYEAPFLGVKTTLIGKRQRGRVVPFGDGKASERIAEVLRTWPVSS